jgi:uncharacterized protein YjdB
MALGRTVQLTATATDAQGNTLARVQFACESSDPGVATASGTGLAPGVTEGSVSITATADGVSGSLQMAVVDADLNGIASVLGDAFVAVLVSHLSNMTRTNVESPLVGCSTAAATGDLEATQQHLASAQAEIQAATDPEDRNYWPFLP